MQLLLRRDQKSGLLGKISFILSVRADLTSEEQAHVRKYRLGDTVLYTREEITDPGSGVLGFASRMAFNALNISVSVGDLVSGKRVECQSIVEMLAVEEQIKMACRNFKAVLSAAAMFGGEEVVAID